MRLPVDLATIKADPDGFARAVFGPGGVASRILPGHVDNPTQAEYAATLVRTALRGLEGPTLGRVTLVEAATGTGKTVAYLTVGLVFALLTGKRFLVSTYTRTLMHQVVVQESEAAIGIARAALGFEGSAYPGHRRKVAIAPRRSRSAFVSPSRAAHEAGKLRAEGKAELADALMEYAALASEALDRARREGAEGIVAALEGTMEAFDALDTDRAELLRSVPQNTYRLTMNCPDEEQALWLAYNDAAREAVGLVVTHAALLIDMSLFGAVTGAKEVDGGYALAVVDEAHALPRAAASAFSDKISLVGLARDASDLGLALRRDDALSFSPAVQDGLLARSDAFESACQDLLAGASAQAREIEPERKAVSIGKDTAWYGCLTDLRDALSGIVGALSRAAAEAGDGETPRLAAGWAADLAKYDRPLQMLLDCIDWRTENRKTGLYVPQLSLTPVRRDPCVQVVPVKAERIVGRLWGTGIPSRGVNRGPMADAVAFTSATLVLRQPGDGGFDAFRRAAWTYGIDDPSARVNADLCDSFEPETFGSPRFVFADPAAPYMTSRDGDEPGLTGAGAEYLALAIEAASRMKGARTGTARQVVLTKSYEDVAIIYESLPESLQGLAVPRKRGQSLQSALDLWRAMPHGILVTPGAHEGLNEPGLIDHVHVYRLPYDPPREIDGRREHFFNAKAEMMRTLRQLVGRGVRRRDDAPTYWVLDVRIAPPQAVQRRADVPADHRSSPSYLAAFPARWTRAMNAGTVFPCPDHLRVERTRNAAPRDEEDAA